MSIHDGSRLAPLLCCIFYHNYNATRQCHIGELLPLSVMLVINCYSLLKSRKLCDTEALFIDIMFDLSGNRWWIIFISNSGNCCMTNRNVYIYIYIYIYFPPIGQACAKQIEVHSGHSSSIIICMRCSLHQY
jgi:hypothetical protein